jgi:hypothetical protein
MKLLRVTLCVIALITLNTNLFAQLKVVSSGNVGIGGVLAPEDRLQVGKDQQNSDISINTLAPGFSGKGFVGTYGGATFDYLGLSVNRSVSSGIFANSARTHAEIGLYSLANDSYIRFMTSPQPNELAKERMRITNNGRVGIGTKNPRTDVEIVGNPGSIAGLQITGRNSQISKLVLANSIFGYGLAVTGTGELLLYGDINTPKTYITINGLGNVGMGRSPDYDLDVNGDTRNTSGIWLISDMRFKRNIQPISQALETINQLNGKSYEYEKEKFPGIKFPSGTSYGFIAQELEKVIPEAVSKDKEGYYSVNYNMLIPFLVEAIKGQNSEIKDLKYQLNFCCANQLQQEQKQMMNLNGRNAELFQNVPNPFSSLTEIKYYLPLEVKSASIMIFDLQGKLLKSEKINSMGEGSSTILASELSPGMYVYTLIADGVEINSKRMILTN